MIDIEGTDKKVKQVDSLLTSITNLIKKHWLILIFITLGAAIYWIWNLPEEPVMEEVETEQVEGEYSEDTMSEEDMESESEPLMESQEDNEEPVENN